MLLALLGGLSREGASAKFLPLFEIEGEKFPKPSAEVMDAAAAAALGGG